MRQRKGLRSLCVSHCPLLLYPGAWEVSHVLSQAARIFLDSANGLRVFAFPVRLGCNPVLSPPGVLSTHRDSLAEAAAKTCRCLTPSHEHASPDSKSSSAVLEAKAEP